MQIQKKSNQKNKRWKKRFLVNEWASLRWVLLHVSFTEKLYQNFKSQNSNASCFAGYTEKYTFISDITLMQLG